MALRLALLALLATACTAAVVVQSPKALFGDWQTLDKRAPDAQLRIIVGLRRPKEQEAERLALDRSNPRSPNFRKWLSFEETQELMRPSASAVAAVEGWLRQSGIAYTKSADAQKFTLDISVSVAERLFNTQFHVIVNRETRQVWQRAGPLSVPEAVAPHVSAIFGAHGLPASPKQASSPDAVVRIGPTEIRKRYQVPSSTRGSGNLKARQAVAEFQGQFMDKNDLVDFFKNLVPDAQSGDDQIYKTVGNVGSGEGIEALLDIEYIMGNAPGVKTEFWAWKNFDFCQDLKNWTSTIISTQDKPVVHSVSYGWQGDLGQIGCQSNEVNDIDADFKTIASSGTTIIFASGDSGSGYQGGKLWPSWPASSPWVTAVGSTCFTDSSASEEEATTQFGSGSGFSSMFPQGSFQKSAVQAYLSKESSSLPPDSMWNRTGRATADVSALGEGYKVYVGGRVMIVGGTSAAAPTFASIISLVNDAEVSAGKNTLGYLNPWLYQNAAAFTDVTKGSDKVSRSGGRFEYGFDCTEGWDPATGLGTPIFPKLKQAA